LEFIASQDINNFISQIKPGLNQICILDGDIGNPYDSYYAIQLDILKKILI